MQNKPKFAGAQSTRHRKGLQSIGRRVSKRSKEDLQGRTSSNKVVIFKNRGFKKGTYQNVKINSCTSATLLGNYKLNKMDYREEAEVQNIKQRFGIIGVSPKINNAIRTAIQVAPTDMSVLISGESGVGKESFSKIIHSLSRRKHGQFIAVNCGAIPEGTIDSELLDMKKEPSQEPLITEKATSKVPTGELYFWMKSVKCP